MNRKTGFLNVRKFREFLDRFQIYRKKMWLNRMSDNLKFPILVFCGLGEPLLHPKIFDIIREGHSREFKTQLVANGSLVTPKVVYKLIDAGLDNLAISLHSLDPTVYHKLTGLDLNCVFQRVTQAIDILKNTSVEVEIWRVTFPNGSVPDDKEEFRSFLSKYKEVKVLGPTPAWNRGGLLHNKFWSLANDGKIWCEKLYFTSSISWNGKAVLCCCDYFQITVPLGNVWKEDFEKIQKRRRKIFLSSTRPEICKMCRRPKDNFYEKEVFPMLHFIKK
jgi:sulfatase maturation enzyme AslB (radical SAM superfamily)